MNDLKWQHNPDPSGSRWDAIESKGNWVIRMTKDGWFFVVGKSRQSDNYEAISGAMKWATMRESELKHHTEQSEPKELRRAPKKDDVWGNPNDSKTWLQVWEVNAKADRIWARFFLQTHSDPSWYTHADWHKTLNEMNAVCISDWVRDYVGIRMGLDSANANVLKRGEEAQDLRAKLDKELRDNGILREQLDKANAIIKGLGESVKEYSAIADKRKGKLEQLRTELRRCNDVFDYGGPL